MKPYFERDGITIYHGDCRDVLPDFDGLVVTDPPYGTGGWRRHNSGQGGNPSGALVSEAWDDGAVDWVHLCRSPIMTFWPAARTSFLLAAALSAGLVKHRCLYMRKRDPKPMPAGRVRWSVEPVWVLSQDGFCLYGGDDVMEASTPRVGRDAGATGHPYEKPISVMRWLIKKSPASPVILDPFMGSGTTLRAALDLGRKAIGIEIEERYCEIAARRLDQLVLPFEVVA